jgi:hypothetical protein
MIVGVSIVEVESRPMSYKYFVFARVCVCVLVLILMWMLMFTSCFKIIPNVSVIRNVAVIWIC